MVHGINRVWGGAGMKLGMKVEGKLDSVGRGYLFRKEQAL